MLQASVQQLSAAQRLGEMLSGLGYPRERNLLLINQYDRKTATLGLEVFKDKLGIMPTCVLPPDRLHVANIASMTEQTNAASRSNAEAAGQLKLLSEALRDAVNYFKV